MDKIPLIEIKNSILLKFASEADSKGNNNSLLDTDEEISIFQTKAKSAIKTGLCTQKDYDDVMKIDSKKIKTQVTTMEDLRNSRLKNNPVKTENIVIPLDLRKTIMQIIELDDSKQNNKDYDEKYYNQMKSILKNQINRYEKELVKVKKDLEKAQNELKKAKNEAEAKAKAEQAGINGACSLTSIIFGMMALCLMSQPIAGATTGLISSLFGLSLGTFGYGVTVDEYIKNMVENNPEYIKSLANVDNLNNMIDEISNSLQDTKNNLDTIVRQKDFLENMENYIKLMDQRESFLNKLSEMNKNKNK